MKSLKQYLKEDWWEDLGSEGQEAYINAHPNSKKAKEARAENKSSKDNKTEKPDVSTIYDSKMPGYIEKYNPSPKELEYMGNKLLSKQDTDVTSWTEAATALMKNPKTPVEIVRKMEQKSPRHAIYSPKVSSEFIDKMSSMTLQNYLNSRFVDALVKNPKVNSTQKEKIKSKLENILSSIKDDTYRDWYYLDLKDSDKDFHIEHIERQIEALYKQDIPLDSDYYKPYVVIDKDSGNTWEFESEGQAREKERELRSENWGSDIRIMHQSEKGHFYGYV